MSVPSKTPNPDKGARYLVSLDQALCNGNWNEISELARKVDKHAPDRGCLTLAARAESQVISASHRPTSASSVASVSIHGLGELVPRLVEAISQARKSHADDAYVASVCLAEIHWLREAPLEALKALSDIGDAPSASKSGSGILGWLEVCEVKARFIKASCLDTNEQTQEARDVFNAAVSQTPGYRTPELRRWTERLLARACMYSVQKIPSPSIQDFSKTYAAFRAWGTFWQRAPTSSMGTATGTTMLDIPRRKVWKAYYDLLSTFLQRGLITSSQPGYGAFVVSHSQMDEQQLLAVKPAQRAEMQQVEATYESILLAETQFPKASQSNTEVEEWVEQAVTNWRIFSGSSWTDLDIGDGGKRAVSQTVLDILYRAATKTFHSTPILRHLFEVHAARGEFDLAMHAFDSYTEIIDRGKARAQKTGKHEIGFDDDDTALLTAAEAVRLLCRYGDRDQIKKALDITKAMSKWLDQPRPSTAEAGQTNGDSGEDDKPVGPPTSSLLKPESLAAVYRAIGIGQAHWAQVTYESETRAGLLADANNNLRRAQKYDETNVETAHALAFVLAQMRDVSGSLEIIRQAIAAKDQLSNGTATPASAAERQRRLLPLWHLLALCLTAEDEFEAAANMCEAAYKQFGDLDRLFGSTMQPSIDPEKTTTATATFRGIVDQMDNCEKESMLQIKMTQIILFELMEGADDAVDQTDELFSLYSRLFGKPEQVVADIVSRPPKTAASQAPSRFGGTLKSITGSIRPRSVRSTRSSVEKDTIRQRSVISEDGTLRPAQNEQFTTNGTGLGPPIAITVTNENGVNSTEKPHHRHSHLPHLPFKGRGHRSASVGSRSPARSAVDEKAPLDPAKAAVSNEKRPDQPLGNMAHNAPPSDWPPPPGHEDQPPQQDVRLPAPHPTSASAIPEPQLAPVHERRHKLTVLVNTWLFSAELYTRAETFDDAENLINDAVKLTETLERELAASEAGSNAKRLFHKGWGKGKSIDQLWADVWCTKAHLAMARELLYDAMSAYEQALFHEPDHPAGIVGLSNLLMDIFEEKLPAEPPITSTTPLPTVSASLIKESRPALTRPGTATTLPSRRPSFIVETERVEPVEIKERKIDPSPLELNRLAARDRAYMLLSNLTKQGAGWDDSEAWFTLARAHELSREIGKAKQALWWVVELENNRPIRPWREACPGGLTV